MNGTEIISFLSNNFPTIISAVGAITGSLFTAIFLRHNTAAKEFEKIKAGQFKEAADELLKSGKMTYTEYYKANNFLTVAKKADEYYSQSSKTRIEEPYDFDWFVRFYESVGNVSNEQMQEIWAKILSGEINHPGSYSLRAIEILKNLSQRDAQLFGKICSFSICSGEHIFIPFYESYLDECKIAYSEIMRLDELGLINSNGMLVLKMNVTPERNILLHNNKLLITAQSANGNDVVIDIKQFPFTDVGRELSCTQTIATPVECFTIISRELSKIKTVTIELHSVISIDGDQIQYANNNLLEEKTQLEQGG